MYGKALRKKNDWFLPVEKKPIKFVLVFTCPENGKKRGSQSVPFLQSLTGEYALFCVGVLAGQE